MRFKVRRCRLADEEHARSRRQRAHTNHVKNVICVARSFDDLPAGHRAGILLHEVGHATLLAEGNETHTEAEADEAARLLTGIRIQYRSSEHGRNLQWLPLVDIRRIERQIEFYE